MPEANQRVKILVVDDENLLAESLAENLRDSVHHYDAYWVNSGKRALEFLQKQPVDLVISDIKMADTSGFDLLNQIRIKHPNVRVILMTGYGLPDIEEEALRRGSLFYLEKPFEVKQLEAAIERVLQSDVRRAESREPESAGYLRSALRAPTVPEASATGPAAPPKSGERRRPEREQRADSRQQTAEEPVSKGAVVSRQPPVVSEQLSPTTDDRRPTTASAPPPPSPSASPVEDEGVKGWRGERVKEEITPSPPHPLTFVGAPSPPPSSVPVPDHVMAPLLQEVLNLSDMIEGGALIEPDGRLLASNLLQLAGKPAGTEAIQTAAAGPLLLASHKALETFGQGEHRQSLIQGEQGGIILTPVGRRPFLLFLTSSQANLGLVLVRVRQRVERAAALLPPDFAGQESAAEISKQPFVVSRPSLVGTRDQRPTTNDQRPTTALFEEVLSPSEWIAGGALIENHTRLVASTIPELTTESGDEHILAADQLLKAGSDVLRSFSQGEHRQSFIFGERGNLILTPLGAGRFMLFLTSSQANLGPLLVQIRRRALTAKALLVDG
jgi:CheY-like chemotaxis protein